MRVYLMISIFALFAFPQPTFAQQNNEYIFQHRILPRFYYENPALIRMMLRKQSAGHILTAYSKDFENGIPVIDESSLSKKPKWEVDSMVIDGVVAYIITPPTPSRSPLCHFIAAIYPLEGDTSKFFVLRNGFYTLEKGFGDDTGYTPLCGWVYSKEGYSHANYGDFNGRSKEKFARRIVSNSLKIKALEQAGGVTIPNKEKEDN